ncbi:MAG: bifunctional oligoribonuclease/PAP phosphatase NrnA [Bacteroidetes bacterium]|nr:MAG: bifunctional oligoribonuclease/PAP phosphatase NrnA [Bacteroidota bacterium]TAG87718.1 MAG: bifunctional oligoribonuclease/PAP phosphatase NrnA [Bacteroidota bacterium]
MNNIDEYRSLMSQPQKVVITTHQVPDADALGSSLALSRYLSKLGHQTKVITPTEYPSFLDWLPKPNEVIVFNSENKTICEEQFDAADVIFCLDFSSYHRLQELEKYLKNTSAKVVLIDHHLHPNVIADFEVWQPEAAATAELIYQFIEDMGDKSLIDTHIAEGIYAGLATDTLSFKLGTTTPDAHKIAANLIQLGLDSAKIHRLIYDNNRVEKIKFLGYILQNKLVHLPEFKTAYFIITAEELKRFGMGLGDTEGIVNYALSIENIVLAAIIIERAEYTKLSLRSIAQFPANEVAEKYFQGGGHRNAAGANCAENSQELEKKFLDVLNIYQNQLLNS